MKGRALRLALSAIALSLGASLALAGCVSGGASAPDPRLDGTWHLTAARDHSGTLTLSGQNITLNIGSVTGGQSACGSYAASVTGAVGVVYIRMAPGGASGCPDASAASLARRYFRALTATHFASVTGDSLQLTSSRTDLQFEKNAPERTAAIANTPWLLQQFDQPKPAAQQNAGAVYLVFTGTNEFRATSGCAIITGTYTTIGGLASVSNLSVVPAVRVNCTAADETIYTTLTKLMSGPFTVSATTDLNGRSTVLIVTNAAEDLSGVFTTANTQ